MSQELHPEYGGRNLRAAHAEVTGNFQRFIEVSEDMTIDTLALNGVDLTTQQLADLGLDEPIKAPCIAYIGKKGQVITKINCASGGSGYLFFQNPGDHPVT